MTEFESGYGSRIRQLEVEVAVLKSQNLETQENIKSVKTDMASVRADVKEITNAVTGLRGTTVSTLVAVIGGVGILVWQLAIRGGFGH